MADKPESEMTGAKVLVTGAAGFIGFHLARRLTEEGCEVVGLDNINDYYSVDLKLDRLAELGISREAVNRETSNGKTVQSDQHPNFRFIRCDLQDAATLNELFEREQFEVVINLAAQAGVRYSLRNPHAYMDSNISGFLNILEACRHHKTGHLIFASSSSVYGANTNVPFSVQDNVDHPISLYAATKKSNELMAHTYSSLYDLPATGLRFFTVYGPWGRPDMALFLFTRAMINGEPIDVFNHGDMKRDFTYVDDIVESIVRLMPKIPEPDPDWSGENPDPSTSFAPYRLFNIGHNKPINLMEFIREIEKQLETTAEKNMMPMQPGDVPRTWADVEDLFDYTGYKPQIGIQEGIKRFIEWYTSYYKL